jgi:hypothetical protein
MKKIISFLLITLLFLNTLLILATFQPVESKFLNNLGNPNDGDTKVVTLEGEGELFDGTTYFDVPLGQGSVIDAQLNITVMDHNNSYPLNPSLNVGLDSDIEWAYTGTGVGHMGYQEYFHDGSTKRSISFTNPSGGSDLSSVIKLPKDAQVSNANVSMKGRFSKPEFTNYNFSSERGLEGARYIELADINNDGWFDAVVTATIMDKLVWYENDHSPRDGEWESHEISSSLGNAWALDVADMDNDNDWDVVATSNDASTKYGIFWYENVNTTDNQKPGNGSSWTPHRIDSVSNYIVRPESVKVADLDADGDNDTIVGSNDKTKGGVYWFENKNGLGTSWKNYTIFNTTSTNSDVTDIEVGNINHTSTGRLDVVATIYGQNMVAWFENDGDPVNTSGHWKRRNIYSRQYPWRVEIAAMDSDSKNDVVVGYERSNGVYWYKNPTSVTTVTSWSTNIRVGWIWYIGDLKVAKVNNDNRLDVIATSYNWDYIYYFRNNNAGATSFSTYSIDYNFYGPYGIAVENIDKDGNGRDIAIAGYDGDEVRFYRNQGGAYPSWETCSIEEVTLNGPQGVFCADIDRDGDNDTVVLGNRGGDVVWMEAPVDPTNASQQWMTHIIDNYLNDVWELFVGDINGDGWLDVAVTGQQANSVVWYECPGNPESVENEWNKTIVDSNLNNAWGIHIADIDDDGDMDIVASGRYADDLVWYRNNDGNGTSWSKFYIDNSIRYPTGIWVEDMDGDGDMDVVVGSYYWSSGTGVRWYEAPSDPTAIWTMHTIHSAPRYVYDVHVADIDNDGNPDVVVAPMYDRYLRWYEAPDEPKNGTWIPHDIWSSQYYYLYAYNLWVDDIGNDGYWDVVVGSSYWNNNAVYWFEAPDQPELDMPWIRYVVDNSIQEPRGVFIADIDGDIIQDIIASEWLHNRVKWYSVSIKYPQDVTLSLGSTDVFSVIGKLDINLRDSANFASVVNEFLAANSENTVPDEYGNEFIEVRIRTSTASEGRVTLEDIDVLYDYTATVTINPRGDLAWEITDLIPAGSKNDTHRIFIGFKSDEPCKVRISDLSLEYNGAPETTYIPDKTIEEDSGNEQLYYLPDFFSDDYQTPEQLYYEIVDWTNKEYVNIRLYQQYYLSVNCTKTPNSNWYGTTEVKVAAFDIEGIKTRSNTFNIEVTEVNDLPYSIRKLPDLKILYNTTNTQIDLDREKRPYFEDIESDKLYFDFSVNEKFENNISVNLSTENILEVSAIGGPAENITVKVYCDDKPISHVERDKITVFQEFHVEIVEIINEAELKIPRWDTLPDCELIEDDPGVNDWIYLPSFVSDYDDDSRDLEYSIISISNNGFLDVVIDGYNSVDIYPMANFDGISEVVLKVIDEESNYGIGKFYIKMTPVNDPPTVEFLEPTDGATVMGVVSISGSSFDIEGTAVQTQLKLGKNIVSNNWLDLEEVDGQWTYILDTRENYPERTKLELTARGFDGELYSENYTIEITIDNTLKDSDNDGVSNAVDKFPNDPKEWSDLDDDSVGDNEDPFDRDPTQWSDQDGDGYGDNPKGKGYDLFPLDPTQFKDKDGDGYGDNPDGNNPDLYPDDPDLHSDDDLSKETSFFSELETRMGALLPVWIIVSVLIIIDIYLISFVFMARSGRLEKRRAKRAERAREKAARLEEKKQLRDEKKKAKKDKAKAKGKGKGKDDDKGEEESPMGSIPKPPARPIVFYPKSGFGGSSGFSGSGPGVGAPGPGQGFTRTMPMQMPGSWQGLTPSAPSTTPTTTTPEGDYNEQSETDTLPFLSLMHGYRPIDRSNQRPMLPPGQQGTASDTDNDTS